MSDCLLQTLVTDYQTMNQEPDDGAPRTVLLIAKVANYDGKLQLPTPTL